MAAGIRDENLVSSCKTAGVRITNNSMGQIYHDGAYWKSSAGKIAWTKKLIRIQLTDGVGKFNRATCAELDIDGTIEIEGHINNY